MPQSSSELDDRANTIVWDELSSVETDLVPDA